MDPLVFVSNDDKLSDLDQIVKYFINKVSGHLFKNILKIN